MLACKWQLGDAVCMYPGALTTMVSCLVLVLGCSPISGDVFAKDLCRNLQEQGQARPECSSEHTVQGPAVYPGPGGIKSDIVGGTKSWDRPAIGTYNGCTATLVSRRVVLTAAHCVTAGAATFDLYAIGTGTSAGNIPVVATRVMSEDRTVGAHDIALVVLDRQACSLSIPPEDISSEYPADGADIRVYGFGCTQRPASCPYDKKEPLQGNTAKMFIDGKLGGTNAICHGDSGGPVFHAGKVIAVNSGYSCTTGTDVFAPTILTNDPHEWMNINLSALANNYGCDSRLCPDGTAFCTCTQSCGKGAWCSKQTELGNCQPPVVATLNPIATTSPPNAPSTDSHGCKSSEPWCECTKACSSVSWCSKQNAEGRCGSRDP